MAPTTLRASLIGRGGGEARPVRRKIDVRTGSTTATAALALADGTVFRGRGLGARGEAVGEICFNTAMSGYQEILTDPSYAGQIITFTFPHIGNVGTNEDDLEAGTPRRAGWCCAPTSPSPPTGVRPSISNAGSRGTASSASPASTPGG